ncbi:MAG: periplasmic heavy metal sensor [Flavipsychrobacter sp.]|nr:periplasmic heavy metal sensor [Flavipsychrobacter sp.]
MEKSKFYLLIILGLLLSNGMLVGYVVLNREHRPAPPPPHGRMHRGPRDLIIKRLGFDGDQVARYDELIKWHRHEIDDADRKVIELKNTLYLGLTRSGDTTQANSIMSEIAGLRKHIEEVHYKHFLDIRGLCKPDQLPEFDELTRDMASLFAPGGGPKPPRP